MAQSRFCQKLFLFVYWLLIWIWLAYLKCTKKNVCWQYSVLLHSQYPSTKCSHFYKECVMWPNNIMLKENLSTEDSWGGKKTVNIFFWHSQHNGCNSMSDSEVLTSHSNSPNSLISERNVSPLKPVAHDSGCEYSNTVKPSYLRWQ